MELMEKDFWVCWSLHRLSLRTADLPATLLFKGGTSLSKVFDAIDRFSAIRPSGLGGRHRRFRRSS
ncbi:MAG: nucleotidyl transferase AbiEii/AbiGii toxin family protein [Candidatus Nealsonbacteria bacterium]|nr:nucleotidyl transferase AbiEii/AbiGii toxin family protein [Candidatus Nealsonbacteria bacterium]